MHGATWAQKPKPLASIGEAYAQRDRPLTMKVNTFIRDINPYLDRPYENASLTEYIVELMPPSLTSDGLAILRELERDGASNNHMKAQGLCENVVEAHAKSK